MKEMKQDIFRKAFRIGNIEIGGQKSEIPTVLIGSIFYMRHKIVKDDGEGLFDETAAERLINHCQELSERYGVGFMLDVIGSTPKALVKYVTFIKSRAAVPVLVNSTSPEVRLAALRELAERDLLDGIVYNSINGFGTDGEMDVLAGIPVEAAVVQAYSLKSKKPEGPLKALLGTESRAGLLEKVLRSGIRKIMVDIPILDLPSVGMVGYSARLVKERLGVPVGTAPANAVFTSEWMRDRNRVSPEQFRMLNAAVTSYLVANECNFLFFGPLEGADWVFPACALADAMNVYGARHLGISPQTGLHPMYKVF